MPDTGVNAQVRVYSEAQQLQIAQQVLDTHVTCPVTGRCRACGAPGPCFRRETAMAVWSVSRWLPHRVPMLSQPERIGVRRVEVPPGVLWANGSRWAW